MLKRYHHAIVTLASLSLLALGLAGCGGSSSNNGGNGSASNDGVGGTTQAASLGTVVLANGTSGVAIVHIEDANGNLLSTPQSTNIPVAGSVVLVSEPADFSQGIIAENDTQGQGVTLQTLNNAGSSPQVTDNVALTGGGEPLSISVIADTTFSVVQMSQFTGYLSTCFTGGLHVTEDQNGQVEMPPSGQPSAPIYLVSPDGSGMVARQASGGIAFYALSPMTGTHGENISSEGVVPGTVAVAPVVAGRGALAWDPGSDTVLVGGQDGSLMAISNVTNSQSFSPSVNSIYLPGTPAVASIAYAPSGQYAVVATASGLFTVSVSSGVPAVVSGPVDPTYSLSDGGSYKLDQAQSIAITSDGKFLVALTDQPSNSNGTLLAMPIDASGNVGAVGMAQSGFLAQPMVDDLFAH